MGRSGKKTFRDASYYAHVIVGKRTVKEGEACAVWTASGRRVVIEGPRRVRLWLSHVRFLDRAVADLHQYLAIAYRDGRREHVRGPTALFVDPCIHEAVEVKDAFKLSANSALVVYRECEAAATESALSNGKQSMKPAPSAPSPSEGGPDGVVVGKAVGLAGNVLRRIVHGPAVYVPGHEEWVHTFSWHGTPRTADGDADQGDKGADNAFGSMHKKPSKGRRDDWRSNITGFGADGGGDGGSGGSGGKQPNRLRFQVLRCMPEQMYCSVKDVRSKDDAQITVHLMLFYELVDIERMLDTSSDPIGDFINAASADVMGFGAANTYESLLEHTDALSDVGSFPTVAARMKAVGYKLHKVVYRGYSTSPKLQQMHDEAIATRTQLRLQGDTSRLEQQGHSLALKAKEGRSQGEQALEAAEHRARLELERLEAEQRRAERDADHAQKVRHSHELAEVEMRRRRDQTDEELRRAAALKELSVDLTRLMCAAGERQPDKHYRIDSATGSAIHLQV